MVMRFEIAVHAQRGRVRSYLSQQPAFNEKPQIVVDGGERNGWNTTSDCSVNIFGGIMSVGSDDGLINNLPLVRDRQAVFCRQFTELFVGEAHNYRIRMIIKRRRVESISKSHWPVEIPFDQHWESASANSSRMGCLCWVAHCSQYPSRLSTMFFSGSLFSNRAYCSRKKRIA